MVEVARDHGTAAHLVPDEQHLEAAWLKDVSSVGISAGASAPEILVDGLVARLAELGFDQVELQRGEHTDHRQTARPGREPLAGDSGDGMQRTGDRFTAETAGFGNDLSTLPNFPAEIRAPTGTLPR